MKKQEIVSVLFELNKITGFRTSLHDTEFNEVAAYPAEPLPVCKLIHSAKGEYEKCLLADAEAFKAVRDDGFPKVYTCRHGLTEAISPLYNFGILTGYLMMGQVLDSQSDKEPLLRALIKLGTNDEAARACVEKMRVVPMEMIGSYIRIMTICAQYLTLSNAVTAMKPTVSEAVNSYIRENVSKRITIKDICDEVGCSKTKLISTYKRDFGITINDAINAAKVEEAKRLLETQDIPMSQIAEKTGFYDQSYFSKVFTARCGMTPSEYRRKNPLKKKLETLFK